MSCCPEITCEHSSMTLQQQKDHISKCIKVATLYFLH